MDRGSEETFFHKDIQMANRYMKIYLRSETSLVIREMQTKTMMTSLYIC